MDRKLIVVALGGNALGKTPEEQLKLTENTAKVIVEMAKDNDVVVGHGNGPQVGMIYNAMEFSYKNGGKTPSMPFPECGAMSQGYIGYHLSQSIRTQLKKQGLEDRGVACLVTQVEVDAEDPAFDKPTKPIGSFLTKEEAEEIHEKTGYTFVEDSGRGYRRVVPSPIPQSILEEKEIRDLVGLGTIVIATGGGGVPVVKAGDGYEGRAAVIDKDRSASRLAIDMNADQLVILTAVEHVAINFGKENQEELKNISVEEAQKYMDEGQFAEGSMKPKVEACLDYLANRKGGKALITSLEKAAEGIQGKTGTVIHA